MPCKIFNTGSAVWLRIRRQEDDSDWLLRMISSEVLRMTMAEFRSGCPAIMRVIKRPGRMTTAGVFVWNTTNLILV